MDKGRAESIRRVPEQIFMLISGHKNAPTVHIPDGCTVARFKKKAACRSDSSLIYII